MSRAPFRYGAPNIRHSDTNMVVLTLARTNVQLLNQLIRAGMPEDGLVRVRAACDLANELYSGYFHADGKPFLCHGVAVASAVAHLGLSEAMVVTAVLHNVYGNGDFGDGLRYTISPARRARVRARVGVDVEERLVRFFHSRLRDARTEALEVEHMSESDRELLLLDLADHFEKYADGALAYYGDFQWIRDFDEPHAEWLQDLAARLGHPEFGQQLSAAMREQRLWLDRVPPSLRTAGGQKYMQLRMPGSCERKASLRRRERWARARRLLTDALARVIRRSLRVLRSRVRGLLALVTGAR